MDAMPRETKMGVPMSEQDSQRNPDEDFKRHQNTSSLGTTKGSRLVKMRHQRSTRRTACKVKAMGTAA